MLRLASLDYFFQCLTIITVFLIIMMDLSSAQNTICKTATGEEGTCMHYNDCEYVKKLRAKYGKYANFPDKDKMYLVNSKCESIGVTSLICCSHDNQNNNNNNNNNQNGRSLLEAQDCGFINGRRVAYGQKAPLQQFPWMALLKYNDTHLPYKCGGSLITNRYVLTAAHCIKTDIQLIGVVLGEHDISSEVDCQKFGRRNICNGPVENFGIERQLYHPEYSRELLINDIGLLKLDREVVFKQHIQPICLPIYSNELDFNQKYYITGWGTTETGRTSSILLYAELDLKNNKYCEDIFSRFFEVQHLCAVGGGREDSCKGDSGGPLFANRPYNNINKYIQYGVVSFGVAGCGRSESAFPGIYANIVQFLPWIEQNIVQ